jgi:hypothetical protein
MRLGSITKTRTLYFDTGTSDHEKWVDLEYIMTKGECEYWSDQHYKNVYIFEDRGKAIKVNRSKDILCELQPPVKHIPEIKRLSFIDNTNTMVYKMPYYSQLSSSHTEAFKQYNMLKRIQNEELKLLRLKYQYSVEFYKHGDELIDNICRRLYNTDLIRALTSISDISRSYSSSYTVDFRKNNLSVNRKGEIILRDVIIDLNSLIKNR